jgi:anti-sigma factor RsiW
MMHEAAYGPMTDDQKLQVIVEIAKTMSQEFKNRVVAELAEVNAAGETQVTVSSNEQIVCVNFGRPLAWFAIPKAHALQLGVSLMEHAGARLEQIERPKPDAS